MTKFLAARSGEGPVKSGSDGGVLGRRALPGAGQLVDAINIGRTAPGQRWGPLTGAFDWVTSQGSYSFAHWISRVDATGPPPSRNKYNWESSADAHLFPPLDV